MRPRDVPGERRVRVALQAVTGRRGGPRTYALELLRALVALPGDDEYVLLADAPTSEAERGGAPWHCVPMPGGTLARPLSESLALPVVARRVGADVVHCTKQTLPRGLPGAGVVTVLDLAPLLHPETFGGAAGVYLRRTTRAAVRRADRVIAISEHTARDLRVHLDVPAERIRVVPLGVDPRFFAEHSADALAALRARLRLPERYLLSVGTLQPRKNVDVLLDALDLLRARGVAPPPLVVAGRTGWQSDALLARLRSREDVLHLGEVAADDLPGLLAGAGVFVSASSYEGFGLALAEAMAAGCAVVGGAGSASDEVVGDAGLLVPPRDADALADALALLLRDDPARARLATSGRERVRRYTWRATAERTRDVYRELVGAAA